VEGLQTELSTESRRRADLERALRDAAAMFKAELFDKQARDSSSDTGLYCLAQSSPLRRLWADGAAREIRRHSSGVRVRVFLTCGCACASRRRSSMRRTARRAGCVSRRPSCRCLSGVGMRQQAALVQVPAFQGWWGGEVVFDDLLRGSAQQAQPLAACLGAPHACAAW
jgi:hypothetical protein